MFTIAFWKATAERAIKSAAQAVALCFTFSDTGVFNAFELEPGTVGGFALGGAIYSLVTSIGVGAVSGDGPSLAPAAEAEVALAPLTKGR